MATRFPNGIETTDLTVTGEVTHSSTEALSVASITTTGNGTIGGTLNVTGASTLGTVGANNITASYINNSIDVDCTDDVTLSGAQLLANIINITASGTEKVLILGMAANKFVFIKNAGLNDVTIKNATENTGVAATTVKSAFFLTTAAGAEPVKITADI